MDPIRAIFLTKILAAKKSVLKRLRLKSVVADDHLAPALGQRAFES